MSEKTTKTTVKKTATKTAAKTATKPAVKKPATKKPAAASKSSTASTKPATKKPASKTESKRATKKAENIGALTSTFGLPTSVENEELKKPKITPRQNPAKAKRQSMTEKSSPKSQKATQAFDSIKKANEQKSTELAKSDSTSKKLINSLKIIENISHTLGISDRERITFDIEEVSSNELRIRIVNGTKNFKSPWFAIKNEEPYIFMPAEILDMVFRMLRTAQKESFDLRLERSIWQHMPIDFGDVWRVAMDELARGNFAKEPDLEKLIAKIKQEHPNLFVDMTSFIAGE
ncbi:MAG: DUF2603 domain-containing protein [Campylobacter sp.]|uniref:DUF2603 domain-containing protein n=1 Tax=Campylobacter sp. TaxID=205 RepID=UPI002AA8A1CD|nr:DUF2603 domain-containing protein [Campylobacter sp.]MCI6343415.1 DUF2603 domain-containing protein [Campylobacter sp.]MCI6695541.1 DUF2603 domain-containing protein [Campylobacter sp.]MCI7361926.1 DUF2603 domain-containing protein [Campylobacter sp.]